MDCWDKSDKLEENLTKRFGINPDDDENYVYSHFESGEIVVRRVVDGEDGDKEVRQPYNDAWSLEDWKAFRDRCLQELRQ